MARGRAVSRLFGLFSSYAAFFLTVDVSAIAMSSCCLLYLIYFGKESGERLISPATAACQDAFLTSNMLFLCCASNHLVTLPPFDISVEPTPKRLQHNKKAHDFMGL